MSEARARISRIKLGLAIAALAVFTGSLTGCVGYADGGYGGPDYGPDVYLFGGGYDRGGDVHNYSHRGAESRSVAHSGGGHGGGGHGGGGGRR